MPRKSGGSDNGGPSTSSTTNLTTTNTLTIPANNLANFQIHPNAGQKPIQVRILNNNF